nr:MAG TPA: hypothetical protein [Bacteriophage sp.]
MDYTNIDKINRYSKIVFIIIIYYIIAPNKLGFSFLSIKRCFVITAIANPGCSKPFGFRSFCSRPPYIN